MNIFLRTINGITYKGETSDLDSNLRYLVGNGIK